MTVSPFRPAYTMGALVPEAQTMPFGTGAGRRALCLVAKARRPFFRFSAIAARSAGGGFWLKSSPP
jgi:hypothetical protein